MEGGEVGVEVGPGEGEGGGERRGVGLEVFECFAEIFFLRVDELQSGGDCFHRRHCWEQNGIQRNWILLWGREREIGPVQLIFFGLLFSLKGNFTFVSFKHYFCELLIRVVETN